MEEKLKLFRELENIGTDVLKAQKDWVIAYENGDIRLKSDDIKLAQEKVKAIKGALSHISEIVGRFENIAK